jgi:NAD(P)-dependent dehydrogenase (short-subunit alcohol dehydrogenase family)
MNLPYFDLTGKVAIVSGGATGIGNGIAEGLAEAGADLAIIARRGQVCEQACHKIEDCKDVKAIALSCDITDLESITAMLAQVMDTFGRIDILVNNAGVGGSEKPILEMTEKDWDIVMNTNLKGVFNLTRVVVPKMIAGGNGGKVINVASIGAVISWPNMSAYCASKGGCLQLTKSMALEWVRHNIQVNAILPGYFETPMNTDFFASDAGRKVIKASIPIRRIAQIDEIKGAAILLASKASSFITGSAITVDGGHTCS